jgi:hypothetical protein
VLPSYVTAFTAFFDLGLATGLERIIIRRKNPPAIFVSLDLIDCAAAAEIEAAPSEPI